MSSSAFELSDNDLESSWYIWEIFFDGGDLKLVGPSYANVLRFWPATKLIALPLTSGCFKLILNLGITSFIFYNE